MGVLLEFKEGELVLHGTDFAKGAMVTVPCECDVLAKVLTNFMDFKSLVSRFAGDVLSISFKKDKILISDDDTDLELNVQSNVSEYPVIISEIDSTVTPLRIDCQCFVRSIMYCLHACSTAEQSRFALCNVYIHSHHSYRNQVKVYCADGNRMAWTGIDVQRDGMAEEFGLLVPIEAARAIIDLFGDENGEVVVSASASSIWINSNNIDFHARLGEGRYPDVLKMVKNLPIDKTIINADKLRIFLRQAAVLKFGDDTTIDAEGDGNLMHFSMHSSKGKAKGKIACDLKVEFSIGLDYLSAAVQDSNNIEMGFIDKVLYVSKKVEDIDLQEIISLRL